MTAQTLTQPIYRNRAQCTVCHVVIESTYRHDFVRCQCGAIFVDGGRDYWRWGYDEAAHFRRLTDDGGV